MNRRYGPWDMVRAYVCGIIFATTVTLFALDVAGIL